MSPALPRLLLVDDDAGVIHVLNRMLAGRHELRYALSGEAALEIINSWRPDLVLLDAQMPGMTGTELCRRLKADADTAALPVIFVTALEPSGAELIALELGAAGVVSKPLEERVLLAAIARALAPSGTAGALAPGARSAGSATAAADATGGGPSNAARAGAGAAATPADIPPAPGDGRPRLLLVDDDPAAVQTLHAALQDLPAHINFATSGQQCLALARRDRPDLVLLDMYMPGLDGLATLRALKADAALAETQVIIVTRFAYPEMELRALQAGGVDFIAKPYTQAVLKARVSNVLRLREQARAAQDALRERWQRIGNARLAQVVAAASDAIVTADAAGQIVLINAAACEMFGVDAARTMGQPLATLLPGLPLGEGLGLRRERIQITGAAGRQITAGLSISRLAGGAEALTTVVLRDLTEQERIDAAERARAQAEAALQAKTMMLSYIAHEVGNPLASIIGLTTLLKSGDSGLLTEKREQLLQYMAESGEHLKALMRDVLDIHRIESGRFDMHFEAVDAAGAAERALRSQAAEAGRQGVQLLQEQPEPPPPAALRAWADATRLQQCLINLVSNAVKYNRSGGHVRLRQRAEGQRVLFEIEDDGLGMSAEQQQSLFEPFNRLGRSEVAGAGVGLALTRMLVLAMQGRIHVRSRAGRGSCFTIELPAVPA